jgi:O-methyltransferase
MSRLPAISRFILDGSPPSVVARAKLVGQIFRNTRSIPSASTGLEQLYLCGELFKVPRDIPGVVIELGCYRGSATATLSLACKHVGRKLIVCDSFQGLPELEPGEERQSNPWNANPNTYAKGEYAGSLQQVKDAVQKFGAIEVCTFIEGYFSDTLPKLGANFVMIFEDADLVSSVCDVLRHTWPELHPGCKFFCHEAQDLKVASLFFQSQAWWREPPGLIGAGTGLPLSPRGCNLSYAIKGS